MSQLGRSPVHSQAYAQLLVISIYADISLLGRRGQCPIYAHPFNNSRDAIIINLRLRRPTLLRSFEQSILIIRGWTTILGHSVCKSALNILCSWTLFSVVTPA
jgi:hypothetical protein